MDTDDDLTILRSSTGADFLATLPTLVGRTVTNSLLVIPFAGKRTHGVMRIDLPPVTAGGDDHDRIASVALGAMSRIDWCDGVMFAVYTDDTFPAGFAGHEPLITRLDERFDEAGFRVKDAYCVAADGWASWFEQDPGFDGHPLGEIAASPMATEAQRVRGGAELPRHDDAALPTADPDVALRLGIAVHDLLVDDVEPDAFGRLVTPSLPDPVDFVEKLLRRDADETPVPVLARLAAFAQNRPYRDSMMLQMAFGRKVGRRAHDESERWLKRQAESGKSMDEVVRDDIRAHGPSASAMGELIVGETSTPPRPKRMTRAIDILGRTIAHLPVELRPDLLCMLAWLQWALGSSTTAGAHIDAALAIDPAHGMAQILYTLVSSGKIPQWVFAHYNQAGAFLRSGQRSAAAPADTRV